jgi:1-deoxy-D-xylulose-5-phosphate reductoisomerase
MRKIVILGSTGSIGVNTLDVISKYPKEFSVVGLTAFNNVGLLKKQIEEFRPRCVAIKANRIRQLKQGINSNVKIFEANSEIENIVSRKDVDLVVVAISGSSALRPLVTAIRHSKTIALANKEALVMAGSIVMNLARRCNTKIIPIDSEQSAIFQCLEGRDKNDLRRVYLTASGGPLKSVPRSKFKFVSRRQVLRHPRWKMGQKITVDSATLMNKGLELIETKWLFDVSVKDIEIIIHKEAVIHSMVEFIDGSILAQLGITDMRLPIQYALSYPKRLSSKINCINFSRLRQLCLETPDYKKFPCLKLAYEIAQKGGSAPCVLNAANEVAVQAFLKTKIKYLDIYRIIEEVITKHKLIKNPTLNDITFVDDWARRKANELIYN